MQVLYGCWERSRKNRGYQRESAHHTFAVINHYGGLTSLQAILKQCTNQPGRYIKKKISVNLDMSTQQCVSILGIRAHFERQGNRRFLLSRIFNGGFEHTTSTHNTVRL
ncbi:hypothetical protein XU18_4548 [Perkinsela sp. CCAP 1560/4]|nr:hypothetical protein XU18_4548 [Perkinsela sp. CCAP 1560/4]|eukprot:KNH04194.1 hypothetical protein XU18_4548 [Perkinsela sp. CCAP 1560/4]